eukprot:763841-Hanusia_phi.AAC.1
MSIEKSSLHSSLEKNLNGNSSRSVNVNSRRRVDPRPIIGGLRGSVPGMRPGHGHRPVRPYGTALRQVTESRVYYAALRLGPESPDEVGRRLRANHKEACLTRQPQIHRQVRRWRGDSAGERGRNKSVDLWRGGDRQETKKEREKAWRREWEAYTISSDQGNGAQSDNSSCVLDRRRLHCLKVTEFTSASPQDEKHQPALSFKTVIILHALAALVMILGGGASHRWTQEADLDQVKQGLEDVSGNPLVILIVGVLPLAFVTLRRFQEMWAKKEV